MWFYAVLFYGFGGISVLLQILSVISKTDISIKPYILGKFLQAIFSSIYTCLALKYLPIFNLDIVETSSAVSYVHNGANLNWLLIVACVMLFLVLCELKHCLNRYLRLFPTK